ncbi:MAG: prepilin-type N-terminal cleavage/methylation domain-containing protein [Pusillimonas sp.]
MPILVPGPVSRQRGFTLLEMMIVLLIIGIATTLVSISMFGDNRARALRQDATRLAHVFTAAQAEAWASGQSLVWEHDAEGYRFSRLPRQLILPARRLVRAQQVVDTAIGGSSILRPRQWVSSGAVALHHSAGTALVFGTDWIPGPLQMALESEGHVVRLSRLGNGRFVVEP